MGLQPCPGDATCPDPRWCRAFWSKDPDVRHLVVSALGFNDQPEAPSTEWTVDPATGQKTLVPESGIRLPSGWTPARRHGTYHRPLAQTDFTYSHPGALSRANPKAIVVGFECRSCHEWFDREPVGRLPMYHSSACRKRAWRQKQASRDEMAA